MNIFFAAPFTEKINNQSGVVISEYKRDLMFLYRCLREQGHTVISAHEREEWGKKLMPPNVCTPLDFEGIERCDLLIAIPGSSGGVHVELGYAAKAEKPIIQLRRKGEIYTPLLDGICSKTRTCYLFFRHSVVEVIPEMLIAISALMEIGRAGLQSYRNPSLRGVSA